MPDPAEQHANAATPSAPKPARRLPLPVWLAIALGLLVVAFAPQIDRATYHALMLEDAEGHDWYWMLRMVGDVRTWLVVALAFGLIDRGRIAPYRRAALTICSPVLAGLLAEAAKLIVRRLRPEAGDGHYLFRPFADDTLSTSGLGFPSSHTAVAFGAAFILTYLHPRAWPVWIALGIGCAASRLFAGAHFLTDAVGGAAVGWLAVVLMKRTDRDRARAVARD